MRRLRPLVPTLLAAVLLLLAAELPAAGQDHEHRGSGGPGRIGVLIADHGEPPEYNEFTYWSFREYSTISSRWALSRGGLGRSTTARC